MGFWFSQEMVEAADLVFVGPRTTRDITGYTVGDVLFLFGFIPEWLLTNWEGVGEVWRIQAAGGWDLVAVGVRAQFPAALEN
jgi:hypothetical protein